MREGEGKKEDTKFLLVLFSSFNDLSVEFMPTVSGFVCFYASCWILSNIIFLACNMPNN